MVLVVVLSEVQQNCTALKDIEVVARAIGYHRDAPVGVELDIPRLFLHILRKINPDCSARCTRSMSMHTPRTLTRHKIVHLLVVRPTVLPTQFLEKRANFEPVRGGCGVQNDRLVAFSGGHCSSRDRGRSKRTREKLETACGRFHVYKLCLVVVGSQEP